MFKKIFFAVSLLISVAIFGQKNEVDLVAKATESLRLAMISGDKIALEALIVPELTYGHSNGDLDDAKEFVDKLVSKRSDFVTIENSNQSIDVVDKTAIVRHHLFAKTNDLGKAPGEVSLNILLIWVKKKNTWKLVARQAVKTDVKK